MKKKTGENPECEELLLSLYSLTPMANLLPFGPILITAEEKNCVKFLEKEFIMSIQDLPFQSIMDFTKGK